MPLFPCIPFLEKECYGFAGKRGWEMLKPNRLFPPNCEQSLVRSVGKGRALHGIRVLMPLWRPLRIFHFQGFGFLSCFLDLV